MVCTSDDDSRFVEPKCVYNGTTGYNNIRKTHKMAKRRIRFCIYVYTYTISDEKKKIGIQIIILLQLSAPTRFPSLAIYEL